MYLVEGGGHKKNWKISNLFPFFGCLILSCVWIVLHVCDKNVFVVIVVGVINWPIHFDLVYFPFVCSLWPLVTILSLYLLYFGQLTIYMGESEWVNVYGVICIGKKTKGKEWEKMEKLVTLAIDLFCLFVFLVFFINHTDRETLVLSSPLFIHTWMEWNGK